MIDQSVWSTLRDALADLYPDEISARRVAHDAALNSSLIQFNSQSKNNWHAILVEANKSDQKLIELIRIVLLEYGDNYNLRDVCIKVLSETNRKLLQQLDKLKQDKEQEQQRLRQAGAEKLAIQNQVHEIEQLKQELEQVRQQLSQVKEKNLRPRNSFASLVIAGSGLGWMVGLSASSIVSIIIISLIGVATIMTVLMNEFSSKTTDLTGENRLIVFGQRTISLLPLTYLIIGIILGTIVGIWARTHNWLGA